MQIISHRGYWKSEKEKNTPPAFRRSFETGFGTEIDIRDRGSSLVISHDIPNSEAFALRDFFDLYQQKGAGLPLALNIKADGLQEELKKLTILFNVQNYFVFDMSVPDGLKYLTQDFRTYTRQSEYEKEPAFYQEAHGVWMDEFGSPWITSAILSGHVAKGKRVSIVSPELHRREYRERWSCYREMPAISSDHIALCTDFPEEAKEFFYG